MNYGDKKAKILDIAMNLNRIGNWAADGYQLREKKIKLFLVQTTRLINSVKSASFSSSFNETFAKFLQEYRSLEKEGRKTPEDPLGWAERMMTWGNILTHRARLIKV